MNEEPITILAEHIANSELEEHIDMHLDEMFFDIKSSDTDLQRLGVPADDAEYMDAPEFVGIIVYFGEEGHIIWGKRFDETPPEPSDVVRADILSDIVFDALKAYEKTHSVVFPTFDPAQRHEAEQERITETGEVDQSAAMSREYADLQDRRDTATILAALRHYQRDLMREGDWIAHDILDIATDGGTLEPMTAEEIDDLCDDRSNL